MIEPRLKELLLAASEAHWVLANLGLAKSEVTEKARVRLAKAPDAYQKDAEDEFPEEAA